MPNIFEFRAGGYQIFDCLPSIAKILVDTAQLIGMSLLSFTKLFTSRRLDSSHDSIHRREDRCIDLSTETRIVAAAIRIRGMLLSSSANAHRYRSRPKIDGDRSASGDIVAQRKDGLIGQTTAHAKCNDT